MRYVGLRAAARISFSGVLAVLVCTVATARAGVIVTSTINNNVAPLAFSETGTFVDAGNFFGANTLRGTNNFLMKTLPLPGGASPQVVSVANGLTVVMAGVTDGLNQIDLGSGTDNLYLTEFFTPDQSGAYLTISGLNAAKAYLIQFPHGENRAIPYGGKPVFKDSNGFTAGTTLSFGNVNATPEYALITLEVSGTTSLEYFMPHSDPPPFRGPSFNGYTVREISAVPSPAAAVGGLGLLGALGLAKLRRKN